jgi:bifunctional UDP-N-acetylglucosamine pyrophosphorylase/glucosamine-1-phosphate N-acetyltransferase
MKSHTKDFIAIILAAGDGTRMRSDMPKVLHTLYGKPMIDYIIEAAKQAKVKKTVAVVGYKSTLIESHMRGIETVKQRQLRGTGDAVYQARARLKNYEGNVLILYGDTPLISTGTLEQMRRVHVEQDNDCTLLTAVLSNPTGYGRVARDPKNKVKGIVEEKDATLYEKTINEINVGAYCFKAKYLFWALEQINPQNKSKEYYLTDVVSIFYRKGMRIGTVASVDITEAIGVNSRADLARAHSIMRARTLDDFMLQGVTIVDPLSTYIDSSAKIKKDTIIYPYTVIESHVTIGESCVLGPFARIRCDTRIHNNAQIGNFAEVGSCIVHDKAMINHHCYIKGATIGKRVVVGPGTITAHYTKTQKPDDIVINDNCQIGPGSILVAPLVMAKASHSKPGSVITGKKHNHVSKKGM